MKILTIGYSEMTEIGGINKNIKKIAEEMVNKGHECIVLSGNPKNKDKEEILNGVKIIRIKSSIGNYLFGFSPEMILFLKRNLDKINPDVIHIHEYRNLLTPLVLYFLRNKKYPVIFSPHYGRIGYNSFAGKYLFGLYRKFTKKIYRWPIKIISNTEYSKKLLIEDFGLIPENIEVIPHGVDKINLKKNNNINKHNINKKMNLLYVGVLQEYKGVHHLIKAIYELKKLNYNFNLNIVGEGNCKSFLKKRIKELDLDEMVTWYGPLYGEELYKQYAENDLFCLLSREETYGIVVAEALSIGMPCVVSDNTALSEFLTEKGCFGVEYPPDPKKVADLILDVYENNMSAGPLSNKIRSWKEIVTDYENIYNDYINNGV